MNKSTFQDAIEIIDALFDTVLTISANDYWKVDIGEINEDLATEIFNFTSFDVLGYMISLDTHGIRHIIKHHYTDKTEQSRGQKAIQKKDFRLLIKMINAPDNINDAGKSSIGNACILIEKEINEVHYFSIWEIITVTSKKKNKKSRIVLQTLYARG